MNHKKFYLYYTYRSFLDGQLKSHMEVFESALHAINYLTELKTLHGVDKAFTYKVIYGMEAKL